MVNEFFSWINEEVEKRGWTYSELARRGGLSQPALSLVLSGQRGVTTRFCNAIAKAFDMPPEDVLRKAKLLPPLPESDDDLLYEVTETFKRLTLEERREVLRYAQYRLEKQREEENSR